MRTLGTWVISDWQGASPCQLPQLGHQLGQSDGPGDSAQPRLATLHAQIFVSWLAADAKDLAVLWQLASTSCQAGPWAFCTGQQLAFEHPSGGMLMEQ